MELYEICTACTCTYSAGYRHVCMNHCNHVHASMCCLRYFCSIIICLLLTSLIYGMKITNTELLYFSLNMICSFSGCNAHYDALWPYYASYV